MSSILAPPPPVPELISNLTLDDSSASSVKAVQETSEAMVDDNRGPESPSSAKGSAENDDAMQVDNCSSMPVPLSNNRPSKRPHQNSIQVNDCTSISAPLPNSPPSKRTCPNTKQNYQEVDDEESNDESDEEMAPPLKSNKTKHQLKLDICKRRTDPVIIGSKYMKIEVIDLTEIEVIYAMFPFFLRILF